MLRLLHTADWHLGARLKEHSLEVEHGAFLRWLTEQVRALSVDVVLVAGDVFDRAQPMPSAQRMFFDGMAALADAGAKVVVLAGDYDGPASLEAPRQPLAALGVHVVAREPERVRLGDGLEILGVPPAARGRGEPVEAFVRRAFVPRGSDVVALGHLPLSDALDTAPRVMPGGCVDPAWFPRSLAYVALGHDHTALGEGPVRASGSPVPLRFIEATPRFVLCVELDGEARVRPLEVPSFRRLFSFEGTPDEVEAALATVGVDEGPRPLASVRLRVARSDPSLILHLTGVAERVGLDLVEVRQDAPRPAEPERPPRLTELDPEAVFRLLLRRRNERLDPELIAAFARLASEVE